MVFFELMTRLNADNDTDTITVSDGQLCVGESRLKRTISVLEAKLASLRESQEKAELVTLRDELDALPGVLRFTSQALHGLHRISWHSRSPGPELSVRSVVEAASEAEALKAAIAHQKRIGSVA
jgi:hypothetical protein